MTRRAIHVSFIRLAAAHRLVTNRFPLSISTGMFPTPTYDRLQLNLPPTTPYQIPQRRAISSNGGGHNTVIASTIAPPPPFRLRVQRRFRPIEDPARPAQPLVLVGTPGGTFLNRYRK